MRYPRSEPEPVWLNACARMQRAWIEFRDSLAPYVADSCVWQGRTGRRRDQAADGTTARQALSLGRVGD